jgi:hypothetical protein
MSLTNAERSKRYRTRHPEMHKESKLRWERRNPERFKEMRKRIQARYEAKHPGRNRARSAKFRTTIKGASCYLYWNAKRRAKIEEVEFTLTKEWIQSKLSLGKCEITGLPFSHGNGRRPWMPSLDRINPELGYIPENVQLVVWLYNAAKAEFTHEDVLILARALVRKEG